MSPDPGLVVGRVSMEGAETAEGIVVVIDVIRAFSVAAYAFEGGAERIFLVREAPEAFALRSRFPRARLAGEIGGRSIAGFDLNNSPARMATSDVRGRTIIQRTGSGTQGACRATGATKILVASLVNARATANHARRLAEHLRQPITFLPTGHNADELIEDGLCADYLEALLLAPARAPALLETGIERLHDSGRFTRFSPDDIDFPQGDIDAVLAVDRFSFAMEGTRHESDGIEYIEVRSIQM